jgi:hypothetical protein
VVTAIPSTVVLPIPTQGSRDPHFSTSYKIGGLIKSSPCAALGNNPVQHLAHCIACFDRVRGYVMKLRCAAVRIELA